MEEWREQKRNQQQAMGSNVLQHSLRQALGEMRAKPVNSPVQKRRIMLDFPTPPFPTTMILIVAAAEAASDGKSQEIEERIMKNQE